MLEPIINDTKEKLQSSYKVFLSDLNSIRTGSANVSLLDGVIADIDGNKMKLNQVSSVSVVNSRMLSINVWDKSNVNAVKDGILTSHLGLNPIVEGQVIRLPIPELTEERRKDLIKALKSYAERAKVTCRNIRRDSITKIKSMEQKGEISEDEMHNTIKKLEQIVNDDEHQIDQATKKKESEILKV